MKKTAYIQPCTTVVSLRSACLMVGGSNQFNGTNATINPNTMEGGDGSDAGSRRRSLWDE